MWVATWPAERRHTAGVTFIRNELHFDRHGKKFHSNYAICFAFLFDPTRRFEANPIATPSMCLDSPKFSVVQSMLFSLSDAVVETTGKKSCRSLVIVKVSWIDRSEHWWCILQKGQMRPWSPLLAITCSGSQCKSC